MKNPPGLVVLIVLVVLGSSMIVAYRIMQPRLAEQVMAKIESLPDTPEGRVEQWLLFGHPQIDTNLKLLRMSEEQPWIVSHLVLAPDGGAPEVHGLDLAQLDDDYLSQEGTTIRIRLPEPGFLTNDTLRGRNADRVPVYEREAGKPDVEERVREMIEWRCERTFELLKKDIPEVEIELTFGGPPR